SWPPTRRSVPWATPSAGFWFGSNATAWCIAPMGRAAPPRRTRGAGAKRPPWTNCARWPKRRSRPVTGQRTPPEVKWTANELAALKGELQRLDQQLERVLARRAGVQARVDALSLVFGRVAPHIPLVQVPVVNVHANYGGRGNLRAWLLQTLRATYPDAVDTAALVQGAIHAFQLTLASR